MRLVSDAVNALYVDSPTDWNMLMWSNVGLTRVAPLTAVENSGRPSGSVCPVGTRRTSTTTGRRRPMELTDPAGTATSLVRAAPTCTALSHADSVRHFRATT